MPTKELKNGAVIQTHKMSDGPTFFGVSLVSVPGGIHSKWQAHFLQIFPITEVYDKLPNTHESDRTCFAKYWKGDPTVTYDQFLKQGGDYSGKQGDTK